MKIKTTRKTDTTENIINDICDNIKNGILPPDAKIAPENKLVEKYGANLYTIRKALNSLKDRKILYSVPKFGVFVSSDAEQLLAAQPQTEFHKAINSEIILASRSQLAGQRAIWENIAKKYASSPLGGRLKLHYVHGTEEVFPAADIYEYGSASPSFLYNSDLLEVKKFFPYIIENKSAVINSYSIPFYYVIPILIFNKNILQKLNIAMPEYSNYEEQKNYIEKVNRAASGKYKLSGTVQELTLHLGNNFFKNYFEFFRNKNADENKFIASFEKCFTEIVDFWSRNAESHPASPGISYTEFVEGKTPFLFGTTSDFIRLNENNINFEYGSAMMYAYDNTFGRIQMFLSLNKSVKNPIECMRAVRHFQSEDIQKQIAETGALPLDSKNYKYLPFDIVIPEKNAAVPLCFNNYDEYYAALKIICIELWEIILCGKSIKNAMKDMFDFSKSYFNMKNFNN